MITFSLLGKNGRLGNQMFQYSAAKTAALECSAIFAIPFEDQSLTKIFNLDCKTYFLNDNIQIVNRLKQYKETKFNYDMKFKEISDNTNLNGYFQAEKYFKKYEYVIRNDFSFKKQIAQDCSEFIKSLKDKYNKKICSIHVRRGDYLSVQNHHPVCSLEYYKEATFLNKDSIFLIFSDDINWCKLNFVGQEYIFSNSSSEEQDLCLMSLCDDNIIANSSFSWWGAWLNSNKNKQVIAPKTWFGPAYSYHNTEDLYCEGWIKL